MTTDNLKRATEITAEITTLEAEIRTLSNMETNTREKKECTHRLLLKKLFQKPVKKTAFNYWSSQDLDSINSIILIDPDEVKVLLDFKRAKIEKLEKELNEL